MIKKLQPFFSPPIFTEDFEKTRIAYLLNTLLWSLAAVILILLTSGWFSSGFPFRGMIILWIIFFVLLGLQLLTHIGRIQFVSALLVISISVSVTIFLFINGTARAPGVIYYVLASIIPGLIISRKAAVITSIINSLAVFVLIYAEKLGMLPPPSVSVSYFQGIAFAVGAFVIIVLLNLATRSIDESVAIARRELEKVVNLRERELYRRVMMERVIHIGKTVTEQTSDLRTILLKIRNTVQNELNFDRVGIFIYHAEDGTMHGSYGTDRSGKLSEEWDSNFKPSEYGFIQQVLNRPDGFFFTSDYEGELNITSDPDHIMRGVKHYAAVTCSSGDKPVAVICVDQLVTGRSISQEQLEALRLFAGYAGLAIQNARLNERDQSRRNMLTKVIDLGKVVTEVSDLRTTLFRIWDSVHNGLDFDRAGVFLYDPKDKTMGGTFGTDRNGELVEEWNIKFKVEDPQSAFHKLLSQPDGFYFTEDFARAIHKTVRVRS